MRKNLGSFPALFPMPVLMIGTYNEDGTVNVMNAAWGMMADMQNIILNLSSVRKTLENIRRKNAFTVSIATKDTISESDYFGMVSGNTLKEKFAKSGFHSFKSEFVNAPIIEEYPITMECEFIEEKELVPGRIGVIGKIANVSGDDNILDENGKVDILKLDAIMYDTINRGYYNVGKKVGQAFYEGNKVKNN